jgi:hypothetical protein
MTRNMRRKCASSEQVSGWRCLFDVLLVSSVVTVLIVGLCLMLAVLHPAGQVGSSRVLADRASGGLYDAPEGYRWR